jgi:hypothetical protein
LNYLRTATLATALVAATMLGGHSALAQTNMVGSFGPNVVRDDVKDVILEDAAWNLGMLREANFNYNRLTFVEYTGHGTLLDLEKGAAAPAEISRFTMTIGLAYPAARYDFEGPGTERTIRAFNADRVWDEGPEPGFNPDYVDEAVLPLRRGLVFLWPHMFTRAAAYAKVGRCIDGKTCEVPVSVTELPDGKAEVKVTVYGTEYTGILSAQRYYETISATLKMPDGSDKPLTAEFTTFRDGQIGVNLENPMDKFYTGVYFPETFAIKSGDEVVLELTPTEAWANPFAIFPGPDDAAG